MAAYLNTKRRTVDKPVEETDYSSKEFNQNPRNFTEFKKPENLERKTYNTSNPTGISNVDDLPSYLARKEWEKKWLPAKNSNGATKSNSLGAANQNGYNSPYATQIDSILEAITNGQPFQYNMNADPLYQQYSQQYQRQGNLAMRDTMGNAAALTGGYGSSYGTTAGSQAYDTYLQQLNDKVPELEQLAYEKYQNDLANKYNQLNALQGLDESSYGRYADNRDFNYNKSQNDLAQQNWQNEFDYGKSQDEIANNQWQQQFDYGKSYDQQQQQNWQNEFNYGKKQDKQAQNNWQSEFDYGKSQDVQSQQNYENEQSYQRQQDTQNQQNWQNEFDYQKQQDAQDREDAKNQYLQDIADSEGQAAAEQSQKRIEKYTSTVDSMFSAMVEDENGNKVKKYSTDDVWNYLMGLGLSDDELALIVNDNYELRQYAESQVNTSSKSASGAVPPHSSSRGTF